MLTKTREIRVETSTCCNYNCIICPRDSFKRKKEVMSQELFEHIVDTCLSELPHIDTITISGFGEFSTDPAWREKISHAESRFDQINILTNMSLLSFEDIDFLRSRVQTVRISIYGSDEKTYSSIHRQPKNVSYSDIRERVMYLCKAEKRRPRVILNFLLLDQNKAALEQWKAEWKDLADVVEIWKPHNWISGRQYRTVCSHRVESCGRPFNGPIQVQVDGTVNVCCFDYNGELIIGDLRRQRFQEIFSSQEMIEVQKKHAAGKADTINQCRMCDQRNCNRCKQNNMVYSSTFSTHERIKKTSTIYEALDNI
jgi:hypothetical protein